MEYKMVAMDMDGTLLNSHKEVSERARKTLKRVSDLGVKLVVCTGRIFTSAWVYADLIGTKAPIIASNGAYIREKDRDEIIYARTLEKEYIVEAVNVIKKYGFYPHIFTWDTIFSEKLIFSSVNYTKWNESLPEDRKVNIEITDDLMDVIDKNHDRILKIVTVTEEDEIEKLDELREKIESRMNVSIQSSLRNNIEIMSEGISKGNGVKILADYYGISRDEIICVGDNENDLSMIEYAGLGIAMGNATDEVKAAAGYVTDTNDNDGVAKALEKFILKI